MSLDIESQILNRYADNIAAIAEMAPATGLVELVSQLDVASDHLSMAGINGSEDLETAGIYLNDAQQESDSEARSVLLKHAAALLGQYLPDMAHEYQLT